MIRIRERQGAIMRVGTIAAAIGVFVAPAAAAQAVTAAPHVAVGGFVDLDFDSMRAIETVGAPSEWLRPSDYPAAAIAARSEAFVEVRLDILPDNRIVACASSSALAISTSADDFQRLDTPADSILIKAACDLLRARGRFRHGLDRDGHPRGGSYSMDVNFTLNAVHPKIVGTQLPRFDMTFAKRAKPVDPSALVFRGDAATFPNVNPVVNIAISKQGLASRCRIVISAGTDAGDVTLCRRVLALRFVPAQLDNGDSVEESDRRFTLTIRR
jgi:hypothetical protein